MGYDHLDVVIPAAVSRLILDVREPAMTLRRVVAVIPGLANRGSFHVGDRLTNGQGQPHDIAPRDPDLEGVTAGRYVVKVVPTVLPGVGESGRAPGGRNDPNRHG